MTSRRRRRRRGLARSSGAHNGRIRTPGPLTRVTAKISSTNTPSAERDRNRAAAAPALLRRGQNDAGFGGLLIHHEAHANTRPNGMPKCCSAERALDQQRREQHEQIDDRDAEQPLRRRLGGLLGREIELQGQRHHQRAAEAWRQRRRPSRHSPKARATRRPAPAPANRAGSAGGSRPRPRPPAASARRRGRIRRCDRATAPRNAAASRRR